MKTIPALSLKLSLVLSLTGAMSALAQGTGQTNSQPVRMNETTVIGTNLLQEDAPIGPNQQPVWTARRRFATTRVYVQPPWQAEVEMTWDATWPRQGISQHLLRNEVEVGLPYRFQLDVETEWANFIEDDPDPHGWHHSANSIELRYALANWGVIPLNPTVNVEWRFNRGAADAGEVQVLLGDEIGPRVHYGINLFYERQIGDDRKEEMSASAALSYTLIDEKLSAGVETLFKSESDKDIRHHPMYSVEVGPSIQWRPTSRTHVNVLPMFGVSGEAPFAELFVMFGIEFGPGSHENEGGPISLQGR